MFDSINKDKMQIKLNTQKNMQSNFFSNLVQNKFKTSWEDKEYKREKEDFEKGLNDSYLLFNAICNKKDQDKETRAFMEIKQSNKLKSLLDTKETFVKADRMDTNMDPVKAINTRYKSLVDTHRTERTQASLNDSITEVYSPVNFHRIAANSNIRLKPLDQTKLQNSTIEFDDKDEEEFDTQSYNEIQSIEQIMDSKEKNQYKVEKRIQKISARLSNIYNLRLKTSLSHKTKLHKQFLSIDKECQELLDEFRDITSNNLLISWREDQKFFLNNQNKLKNLKEQVDIYENSNERQIIEERLAVEDKKKKELRKQETARDDTPDIYKRNLKKNIREINSSTADATTVTLIKQKNEKIFNEMLSDKTPEWSKRNRFEKAQTNYPDISFEKQNIIKWWEQEMGDQKKFYENKYNLFKEYKEQVERNKNLNSGSVNVATQKKTMLNKLKKK